jgi:hypothetical protein
MNGTMTNADKAIRWLLGPGPAFHWFDREPKHAEIDRLPRPPAHRARDLP